MTKRLCVSGGIRRRKLWLDTLDADTCYRIAAYVCNGQQNEDSLCLAETSPGMRKAVMSLLSHKVSLYWNTQYGARWTMIAVPDIRSVIIETHPHKSPAAINLFAPMNPFMLLQAPTLRRVEISDDPLMLWALKGSTCLRELFIRIGCRTDFGLIWGTLGSLNLERLELDCYGKPVYMGYCPNMSFSNYVRRLLRSSTDRQPTFCPNLSSLQMSCQPVHQIDPLGDWLRFFPKLREVSVLTYKGDLSNRTSILTSIESVKIIYVDHSFRLAMHLGSSVTVLHTNEHLDETQVASLNKCPRLRSLSIGMKKGAERGLVDLACLSNLQHLHLDWAKSTVRNPRNYFWYMGPCSCTVVVPQVMLRVAKQATSLVELSLDKVCIDRQELTSILRCIGPRLQCFQTSVCGQAESPFDRLEKIVEAVSLYNPNIRAFDIEDMLFTANENAYESISIQARRILSAIRRLQIRAPLMQARLLKCQVNSWIKDVILYQPGAEPVQMEQAENQWYAAEPEESYSIRKSFDLQPMSQGIGIRLDGQ